MAKKFKLKQEKGVLHIGGGRFFYPGKSYDLSAKEATNYGGYFEAEKASASNKETTPDDEADTIQDDK